MIPIISDVRILELLENCHETFKMYHRKITAHPKSKNVIKDIAQYVKDASEELFNIASCKCKNWDLCSCPINEKIPGNSLNFFSDKNKGNLSNTENFYVFMGNYVIYVIM